MSYIVNIVYQIVFFVRLAKSFKFHKILKDIVYI